ncbi:MAG: peptide chain release factor-like protein [Bryobacteraceae bacterium]
MNWFIGVDLFEPADETRFSLKEVRWETMRASGPGGQHVNRTESAVRVTHLPTGLQATAMEERSQHRNRRLALARLMHKLNEMESQRSSDAREKRWRSHQHLERGNHFGKSDTAGRMPHVSTRHRRRQNRRKLGRTARDSALRHRN